MSELRDVGPYRDADQALQQFANWSQGISPELSNRMMVREALLIAGIYPSDFEMDYLAEHGVDPIMAAIMHGWILRARMAGQPGASDIVD